jgi:hypothetical protein
LIEQARQSLYQGRRGRATRDALLLVVEANAALGTGTDFQIGEGNLMF